MSHGMQPLGTMEEPMELSAPPSPKDNEQSTGDNESNLAEANVYTASGIFSHDVSIIEVPEENLETSEVTGPNLPYLDDLTITEMEDSLLENSSNILAEILTISSDSNPASKDSSQIISVNNELELMETDGMICEEFSDLNITVSDTVHVFDAESLGSAISLEPMCEDSVGITLGDLTEDDHSPKNLPAATTDSIVLTRSDEKEDNQHCGTARAGQANRDSGSSTTSAEAAVPLRRSKRAIKRRRYNDDTMNFQKPLPRRARPFVVPSKDTRAHAQMAITQGRCGQPTDTNSPSTSAQPPRPIPIRNPVTTTSPWSNQNFYQTIIGRGTSVTPVTVRTNSSTQCASTSASQPHILPTLTNDMYVVEVPSFVVPYVYEKPAVIPFREFVDEFGNKIEEQRAGEASGQNDPENNGVKEKSDGRNTGGDHQNNTDVRIKIRAVRRAERRRGRNDNDYVSWDSDSSTYSDDEILNDDEDKTSVIKDKVDSVEEMKNITGLTVEKVVTGKSDNYFNCFLGRFFMNIGHNFVQEFVQNDLLNVENRKLVREKRAGHSTEAIETSIASLKKNLEFSKKSNAPYRAKENKCAFCSFKSESKLVMSHHLETPHMKNNVYKCNYCIFETPSPHYILYHMDAVHNIRGKLERAPAYHQCANCTFEDNGKGKLARHLLSCSRKFKPEANLAPPIEWEPPAKVPKVTRSGNSMMSMHQRASQRDAGEGARGAGAGGRPGALAPLSVTAGAVATRPGYRPRGRSPLAAPSRASHALGAPLQRGGMMIRKDPALADAKCLLANNGKSVWFSKSIHQPSISITPLPRQSQPVHPPLPRQSQPVHPPLPRQSQPVHPPLPRQSQPVHPPLPRQSQPVHPPPAHQSQSTFLICEVCDGYIKDLEQLRSHMLWIHKFRIHPKMIYNRPPLNCQKCHCRFFTDQGLERHLLGSHGLITNSMQHAANKGKDAGRCPVCGRVYQWKLLDHVARHHNLALKPAYLSYKCTVCTATFGMYKEFEQHVYSTHSVGARRAMYRSKQTNTRSQVLLPPIRISDEVTIIPHPVKIPINYK